MLDIVMEEAVQVEGLVKRFGSVTAVDGISFEVRRGEIFGILGPNGAGKTTTLEIIEGLQKPTEGRVTVLGMNILERPAQVKAKIGVQLQSSAYHDYLSLKEILALFGSFYPKRLAPDALLEQVGLLERANSRVNQLSGGQKQRFTVAASLVNSPELVILDEPTTGLDPQARRNLWELIRNIRNRGVTVVLTTHYMEEAEALCDRLAIMDRGQLVAVDAPGKLINQLEATYTVKLVVAKPLTQAQMASLNGDGELIQSMEGNTYLLRLRNTPKALGAMLDEIARSDISLDHLQVTPVTLEDVSLELTGNELRDLTVLALTIANLKMLARNRQAAFWVLFFPLLLVVVFGLIDIKGVGPGSLAIVDQANDAQSEILRVKLAAVELLELEPDFDTEDQARLKVAEGDLDYLVVIPQGFGQSGTQAEPSPPPGVRLVYQSKNGQRNQLVDGLIRSLVAETQDGDLPLPLSQLVVSEVIQVAEVDYFDQVLMGLIGLGIMTNSIISIAVRVSTYRNQAILKRLLVTPLPIWKYFAGEVTAHLALAAVQVAIILLVGVFVFGADIHGNVVWIFLIALLGSMVFLNIGFILSAWAQSPAAASGMGNAVALPMMFFAGTFFSTATLPWVLPHAAYALPLTPMLDALREVAIDSGQLWDTGPQLGILGLWVIATALIASRVFRFS